MISHDRACELIGRLGAKASDPNKLPPGIAGLVPQDIAAALAGSDRASYLMALKKFALDDSRDNELKRLLWSMAVDLATRLHWYRNDKGPHLKGKLQAMVNLALAEQTQPWHCPHCRGAGIHQNQQLCKRCRGSGRAYLQHHERAQIIGIDRRRWHESWRHRYQHIYAMIEGLPTDAVEGLRRGLS